MTSRPPGSSWAIGALVASNVVPLVGVAALGWSLGEVMVLFWAETVLTGYFGIAKLLTIRGARGPAAFLTLHFSGFAAVLGLAIVTMFVQMPSFTRAADDAIVISGEGPVLPTLVAIWPAVALLFLWMAVAFVREFWMGGERAGMKLQPDGAPGRVMVRVYTRVAVLFAVVVASANVLEARGAPVWGLVILVAAKTLVDVVTLVAQRWLDARARGSGPEAEGERAA